MLLLFIFFSLNPLFSNENDEVPQPYINLNKLDWYAKQGFSLKDVNISEKNETNLQKKYKKLNGFPMILNSIFESKNSSGILEYTVYTAFNLHSKDKNNNLSIYLAWIGENWEVYLNGTLIRKEVVFDNNNKIKHNRSFRGIKISLPGYLLKDKKNYIVFRMIGNASPISYFLNPNIGFLYDGPYLIAPDDYLSSEYNDYFKIAINTIYLFFGLYHLFFYFRRKQNTYNLYFAFFALFLAIDGLTKTSLVHQYIYDSDIIFTIKYSSQGILPLFFMLFLRNYFFPEKPFRFLEKIIFIWSIIIFLSYIFSPASYNESILNIFHMTIFPVMAYGAYYIGKAVYHKLNDSIAMAVSLFFIIFTATWDIIDEHLFMTGIGLLKYGFSSYVISIIMILANRFLHVHNESERLNVELNRQRDAFFRFVPTEFIKLLGKQSGVDITLGDSSLKDMSVMFSDIRSFTQISEKMNPYENFQFLNGYLKYVLPALEENEGIVDKYIGDGILALFPKKEEDTGSSEKAIKSAVKMQKMLSEYNASRTDPNITIGIGIHTGSLMLGTVGSPKRIDTTVIGDTVNLASRLESLNSYFHTDILVSETVINELNNSDDYKTREIAKVLVKGKSNAVSVYEIYNHKNQTTIQNMDQTKETFLKATQLYRKKRFSEAKEIFDEIIQINPEDYVSQIYIKKCERLKNKKLNDEWDGIEKLERK